MRKAMSWIGRHVWWALETVRDSRGYAWWINGAWRRTGFGVWVTSPVAEPLAWIVRTGETRGWRVTGCAALAHSLTPTGRRNWDLLRAMYDVAGETPPWCDAGGCARPASRPRYFRPDHGARRGTYVRSNYRHALRIMLCPGHVALVARGGYDLALVDEFAESNVVPAPAPGYDVTLDPCSPEFDPASWGRA